MPIAGQVKVSRRSHEAKKFVSLQKIKSGPGLAQILTELPLDMGFFQQEPARTLATKRDERIPGEHKPNASSYFGVCSTSRRTSSVHFPLYTSDCKITRFYHRAVG